MLIQEWKVAKAYLAPSVFEFVNHLEHYKKKEQKQVKQLTYHDDPQNHVIHFVNPNLLATRKETKKVKRRKEFLLGPPSSNNAISLSV